MRNSQGEIMLEDPGERNKIESNRIKWNGKEQTISEYVPHTKSYCTVFYMHMYVYIES